MTGESPKPPLTARELFARYHAGVLPVFTTDALGDEHVGSAFHVGEGAFVTARHIAENQVSSRVPLPRPEPSTIEDLAKQKDGNRMLEIALLGHPDAAKDVAVFAAPGWSNLPAIPLGGHLDDWLNDRELTLSEVVVMGFPPIPLSNQPVLVAARGEINAILDLIQAKHPHFLVSVVPRGGFSGGVVLSEWDFALGVVTSSLVKNGVPEELGYLTVLTVEPILECLGHHHLLPRDLALLWDGLFTARTEYFGVPEKRWAHSWLTADRDGHRTRLLLATPDEAIAARARELMSTLDIETSHEVLRFDVHCWSLVGDFAALEAPLECCRQTVRQLLTNRGFLPVEQPALTARTLEMPLEFAWMTDMADHCERTCASK